MSRFWSPKVAQLRPYTPGEHVEDGRLVKLNTNENPYGPSPHVQAALRAAVGEGLRLYPDPAALALRRAIGTRLGVGEGQVFIGNGSDEVLAHAFNAFFTDKAPLLFADLTYSFYRTYCELFAIAPRLVPLRADFSSAPEDYRGPCGGVVVANPNAPTGIALPLHAVERIVADHPDTVVLVDEAYVDFGGESAVALVPRYENLLVVQTFSKSRCLAGMRVGFAVAQRPLIEGLERVKNSFNPYPLGQLALVAAQAAWEDWDWFEDTCRRVMANRAGLSEGLTAQGFKVLPSATNFVLASHPRIAAPTLLAALRARGILVRHFPDTRVADWLRIAVGTEDACATLLAATQEILAAAPRETHPAQ